MSAAIAFALVLAIFALAIFVARFLGSSANRPRVDYCNERDCVQSGRCQSGDCQ